MQERQKARCCDDIAIEGERDRIDLANGHAGHHHGRTGTQRCHRGSEIGQDGFVHTKHPPKAIVAGMKRAFSSGAFLPPVTFASTWPATLAAVGSIVHPVLAAWSTDPDVRYWPKADIG